jgi:hypothetical protein
MTAIAHHPHPVTGAVVGVRRQLASVAEVPVWSLDADETTAVITEVLAAEAQLGELKARLLAHADQIDLAGTTSATKTATWLAHHTTTTRPAAFRAIRLAQGLDEHQLTRQALAEGRVHVEQAEVILRALAELPDNLETKLVENAEAHLLGEAAHHDANALKRLGQRLLDVIDPDLADAHEAKLLEREERDAAAAARLVLWDDGHGKVHGRFTLDALTGAMLKKTLLAFAAPKHRAAKGPLGERKPSPERLGQAFTELIQRYPTKRLPKAGGLNATIVVTMTLDSLMGGLKAAQLDTGGTISASMARRIACEAGIIPAVLGGKSELLDLGRSKRFATEPQRIAKAIQVGGCEIDGCDAPAGSCHAHHKKRWADGGTTNLDDLVAICPPHHARAHDQRFEMRRLPTGKYGFHRRT